MHRKASIATLAAFLLSFAGCESLPLEPSENFVPSTAMTTSAVVDTSTIILKLLDPKGDQTGPTDVVGMVMVFNRATGEYRVNVLADRAHPFAGDYRICINLYDRELGTALDPAFFSDVSDHFYVLSKDTSTMYILSGTNTRLKSWNIGNRVFTNSLTGTGNPDGCVVFRSTVTTNFGWGSGPVREDVIAYSQLAQPMVAARAPNPSWTVSKGLSESECRTIAGL